MADSVSSQKRSEVMARVRSRDTRPEMVVRRGLHARGFRYRLHVKDLPGKPDMVFRKYGAVVLINGCFWHGHDCQLYRFPKSNTSYWIPKIRGNIERDKRHMRALRERGWRILIIWECALKGRNKLPLVCVLDDSSRWLINGSQFQEIAGVAG